MKNSTKIIAVVVSILTVVLQDPSVQGALGGLMAAHPNIASIIAGITAILALIHQPNNGGTNGKTQS